MCKRNIDYFKIPIALFLVCFQLTSLSQQVNKIGKSNDIKQNICYEWNIFYRRDTAVKIFPSTESFSSIQFYENGEAILKTVSSKKGTWQYDRSSQLLLIKIERRSYRLKIIKLAEKELLFKKDSKNGVFMNGYLWRSDK